MSDFELYGDYNNNDDVDSGKSKRPILRLLRWLGIAFLILFCGFLVFRLIVADYYPSNLKKFKMTEALAHYSEGQKLDIEALKIEVPYDDNTEASFIAANLKIERNAGAVQFTVRMNSFTMDKLFERTGIENSGKPDESFFVFSLLDDLGNRYFLSDSMAKSYLWYRTLRLCFDGVTLDGSVSWVRLDVYLKTDGEIDYSAEPYASIPVLDFSSTASE